MLGGDYTYAGGYGYFYDFDLRGDWVMLTDFAKSKLFRANPHKPKPLVFIVFFICHIIKKHFYRAAMHETRYRLSI